MLFNKKEKSNVKSDTHNLWIMILLVRLLEELCMKSPSEYAVLMNELNFNKLTGLNGYAKTDLT